MPAVAVLIVTVSTTSTTTSTSSVCRYATRLLSFKFFLVGCKKIGIGKKLRWWILWQLLQWLQVPTVSMIVWPQTKSDWTWPLSGHATSSWGGDFTWLSSINLLGWLKKWNGLSGTGKTLNLSGCGSRDMRVQSTWRIPMPVATNDIKRLKGQVRTPCIFEKNSRLNKRPIFIWT